MKFYIVTLFSFLLSIKCYSQHIYEGIDSVNNKYRLELKDSSFYFEILSPTVMTVKCDGYWTEIKDKLMICNCYEENDLTRVLAPDFMVQRKNIFLPNQDGSLIYFPKDCNSRVLLFEKHINNVSK